MKTILANLISQYGEEKAIMDKAKKTCDKLNKQIKEAMIGMIDEEGKAEVVVGKKWLASYSLRKSYNMNEDKLIQFLKDTGYGRGIIKKKEYIDEEALEKAIYNKKIPEELIAEMDKCRELKETPYLTVKQIREE